MKRLIAATMFSLAALTAQAAVDWPMPPDVKTVDVEGYPLAYVDAGSGVPIVIVHGAWVDHRLFKAQVAEFAKTNRVIAVSLRHHWPEPWDGQSTDYSVEQHARDLVALVRKLGLGRVHLFGHSRGGGVAVAVARLAPELLRTLILAEPSGLVEVSTDPNGMRQRLEGGNALAQRLREVWQSGTAREVMAARAWESVSGPGSWDRMPAPVRQMISDNIVTMTAPMVSAVPPIATCEQVGALRMPVLLLQSSRAEKVYVDSHDGLRRCNAAIAPAVVVPESSHNMHMSNPVFFNQTVLDFVRAN
jgi:pimeloyl-ACP methyl ester carboxylesterase